MTNLSLLFKSDWLKAWKFTKTKKKRKKKSCWMHTRLQSVLLGFICVLPTFMFFDKEIRLVSKNGYFFLCVYRFYGIC